MSCSLQGKKKNKVGKPNDVKEIIASVFYNGNSDDKAVKEILAELDRGPVDWKL